MNKNLDRLIHGWPPYADANWIWWLFVDIWVAVVIVKLVILEKFHD